LYSVDGRRLSFLVAALLDLMRPAFCRSEGDSMRANLMPGAVLTFSLHIDVLLCNILSFDVMQSFAVCIVGFARYDETVFYAGLKSIQLLGTSFQV
jgi:hypothetical protein